MQEENIYIYGKNVVKEAMISKKDAIKRILILNELDDKELKNLISSSGIPQDKNPKIPKDLIKVNHQGVFAVVSSKKLLVEYDNFISNLNISDDTALIVLGQIKDPQNVGAIIRSAAAFGISGVLIPTRNQAPITGAVAKVSAGMIFKIPVVEIGNVNHTIRDLKKKGFWSYGLAGEGIQNLQNEKFDSPTLFVLGSEGTGIREKTKEACDIILKIPMNKRCESLNAASAASVALYDWSTKHSKALNTF